MKLPIICNNLLVQNLNDEVMIYNLDTNNSYCLNSTAATVFNACNGSDTVEDLKRQTGLSDEIIYLSLDELKKHDFIGSDYSSPFTGMSRRAAVKRVGLASMAALPVIASLVAPSAANAASNLAAPGTILDFSTPGTPQTSAQCNTAVSSGASRCASNRIQVWTNSGTNASRNCEGRCFAAV